MRYLLLMWADNDNYQISQGSESDYQAWMDYEHELKGKGVFIQGAALQPRNRGAKYVRPDISKLPEGSLPAPSVGDLQIGGYYLVDCASEDEAESWARKMPAYGMVEVRPELTFDDQSW